jgi:hypothetical protein
MTGLRNLEIRKRAARGSTRRRRRGPFGRGKRRDRDLDCVAQMEMFRRRPDELMEALRGMGIPTDE